MTKRKLLPPRALLISLIAQAPLIAAAWPLHPPALELALGLVCFVIGAGLNIWSSRLFERAAAPICPFSPVSALVETGPYRFTRNPMYLGLVLIAAAPALLAGTPVNLAAALVLWIWLDRSYVRPEEEFLAQSFGAEFAAYCAGRPRWLVFGGKPGPRLQTDTY
jgi:protein-S-isoprenylcysteine O-methyltransferase Ste14